MASALIILSLGFFLGLRHATDSDHVIAVSTIVSRERSLAKAARVGVLWGIGHSVTILAVGAPLILFRWTISPKLGAAMELAVAMMLIILGVASLIDVRRGTTSKASHSHFIDRFAGRLRAYGLIRPVVVGVVHGLAGSAAIVLLVLATIRTPLLAVGYLLIFGAGTILGMVILTTAIAIPVVAAGNHSLATNKSLRVAFALVSLCFGMFLAMRIGIPLVQM